MKLEEAIVYLLASSGHGMKTKQIAREINARGLYTRWDKAPSRPSTNYERVLPIPQIFHIFVPKQRNGMYLHQRNNWWDIERHLIVSSFRRYLRT